MLSPLFRWSYSDEPMHTCSQGHPPPASKGARSRPTDATAVQQHVLVNPVITCPHPLIPGHKWAQQGHLRYGELLQNRIFDATPAWQHSWRCYHWIVEPKPRLCFLQVKTLRKILKANMAERCSARNARLLKISARVMGRSTGQGSLRMKNSFGKPPHLMAGPQHVASTVD